MLWMLRNWALAFLGDGRGHRQSAPAPWPVLRSERGDVNWTPIYLLILAAIAAILLISVIKPLFQSAVSTVGSAKP